MPDQAVMQDPTQMTNPQPLVVPKGAAPAVTPAPPMDMIDSINALFAHQDMAAMKQQIFTDLTANRKQLNDLNAKIGTMQGQTSEDNAKDLHDLELQYKSSLAQLAGLKYEMVALPKPPEMQKTEEQLGLLLPVIMGVMAIGAHMHGNVGGSAAATYAGALNGMFDSWRQGDIDRFTAQSTTFKETLEEAKMVNQGNLNQYHDVINKILAGQSAIKEITELKLKQRELPLNGLMAQGKALEDSIKQLDTMLKDIQTDEYRSVQEQHIQASEKHQERMELLAGQREANAERHERTMEGIAMVKEKRAQLNQNNYKLDENEQAVLTQAVDDGRLDPNRVNSRTAKMLAQMFLKQPRLDMNNAHATAAALGKLETQRSQVETFSKTANKNFDLVEQLYDKNPQGTLFALNKIKNDINFNFTGDPATVQVGRAIKTALMEYAKVVSGQTGGAAVSDSARQEVETLLSMSDNPEAFHGSIKNHRIEMANRESGFQDTINELKKGRSGNVRGGESENKSAVTPRKPGETIADYLKRTGGQ